MNIKEEWDREDSLAGDNLAIIQAAPHNSNYVVIDKANGSLNVFDKDNSLLYQMPVNTGVSGNDYNTITYTEGGKKGGTIINGAGNNSTPAGITYISGVGQYHGAPSFTRSRSLTPNEKGESDDIASSIHYGKLDKKNTKKSNGCVRADGKNLEELQNFIAKGTPVYTLPENNTSRFTLRNNKLSFVADDPYGIDVFKAKPREEYKTKKAYENALKKEAESRKKFAKEHPDMDFDEAHKKRFWDDYNVYTDKSYAPLRIVDDEAKNSSLHFLSPTYYKNRKEYANTLSSSKQALQKDFGITSDTYNHIANVALGIAEQETKFGTAAKYIRNLIAGDKGVSIGKAVSEFFGVPQSPVNSQGITQIKLDADNQAMQEMYKRYGITKDSVKTPEGSALATMVRLLTMYKDEVVGRKFTAYDGSRISPYDALVYKWNGKNRRLTSGKADPKNNPYIQHIAESTKGFSFYEDRDVEGQSLLANNPGNDFLSRRLFAEGGSLKGNYSDWKKAIAEHNGIHVDEDDTYDYEGYYNKYPAQAWAMLSDDPEAHFTDEFKTVNHPSFSNQSKYSGIVDTRFNPEGIIGGDWSEDDKRYTLSEDQARHRWDIGRTMDYFGRAENNGVEGFYPDGRHWTTAEGDPWGGVLPMVTVTPKKARGGYLFDEGGIKTHSYSMDTPVEYNGVEYPGARMIVDGKEQSVFTDGTGTVWGLREDGSPYKVEYQHELPEVTVSPKPRDAVKDYLTESNDATAVADGRPLNPHLQERALKGAKAHALWEEEHPNLAAWSYAAGAAPFAVAAAPLVVGAGDMAAGTALGQGVTRGLTGLVNMAQGSSWLPWADAAATSAFGAHGLNEVAHGNVNPESLLEVAPLGRLARPMYNWSKGAYNSMQEAYWLNKELRANPSQSLLTDLANKNYLERELNYGKNSGKVIHADYGNRRGAFTSNGAYIDNGVIFPGRATSKGQKSYTWWNADKPYSYGVYNSPFTRYITIDSGNVPNILKVREQGYPIGQWDGTNGFVRSSEMVTSYATPLSTAEGLEYNPITQTYGRVRYIGQDKVDKYINSDRGALDFSLVDAGGSSSNYGNAKDGTFSFTGYADDPFNMHQQRAKAKGFDTSGIKIIDLSKDTEESAAFLNDFSKREGLTPQEAREQLLAHLENHGHGSVITGTKDIIHDGKGGENFSAILSHELEHALHYPDSPVPNDVFYPRLNNLHDDLFTKFNSTEVSARGSQLHDYFGHTGTEPLTEENLLYARDHYAKDTGIDNKMNELLWSTKDYKRLAEWMTRNSTMFAVPAGIGLGQLYPEQQK